MGLISRVSSRTYTEKRRQRQKSLKMDDADRVCRLPDDEWQDYDTTYASEIKQRREALLLSYACKHCETTLFLVDQAMEDLPMRQLDRTRVVDALYNANKFTNNVLEGFGPHGKPVETAPDAEKIMRYPPFRVKVNEGCYERRFRISCNNCGKPFAYRLITEDSTLAKFSKCKIHSFAPFDRLTFVNGARVKLINSESDKSKEYSYKKQTTDRGKTATTTVSTIEKDEQDVEQHQILESYHKNVALIKHEMRKRSSIKRKIGIEVQGLDPDEIDGGATVLRSKRERGTLGLDSMLV